MSKNLKEKLAGALASHANVLNNIPRREIIRLSVDNGEAIVAESGALATWTPPESTGRSPKDTVLVKRTLKTKARCMLPIASSVPTANTRYL